MSRHSGGLVPPGQRVIPIHVDESQSRLGSVGSQCGGPLAEAPAGVELPTVVPAHEPDKEDWLPRWVREHVERGTPPAELIDELVERTLASPSHAMLLEASALLNELGRNPDNAAYLQRGIAKGVAQLLHKEAN